MRPRLFLDVDGVINASPNLRKRRQPDEWAQYRSITLNLMGGLRIDYAPALIEWLCSLDDRVEVMWLTTWNEHAPQLLAPALGLPDWPVAGSEPCDDHPRSWWKHSVVEHYAVDRVPFVWLDDELRHMREVRSWLEQLDLDHMAIGPWDRTGVNIKHIEQVETFLTVYGAGPQQPLSA